MKSETLIQILSYEGISKSILSGALSLSYEELDDRFFHGVPFDEEEKAVIRRLLNMTEQEASYIFEDAVDDRGADTHG